jgi:hypothetical protein
MRIITLFLLLICNHSFAQLSIESAKKACRPYQLGLYSYHEKFIGKAGFAAPLVLTSDGGAAQFGNATSEQVQGALLVKLNSGGKEEWKLFIRPEFDEVEAQSVIQDQKGNFMVFLLSYDQKRYRGGTQRVLRIDPKGKILWDKTVGLYSVMKSPTFNSISLSENQQVYIRGQIVTDVPASGKDPLYRYWEGWINAEGTLTQKSHEVIDWKSAKWKPWMEQAS